MFPPNAAAPPIGGPPKPPALGAGPGADALAPGAKAVRDAMVKALDDALKDPEFAASLETTASVEFDVSKDAIEIETDDVIAKGGDEEQPEGDKADAAPSPPKG